MVVVSPFYRTVFLQGRGRGGGGAAGAAQQVVQLAQFVGGEADGMGDALGQVGEAVAQGGAVLGEVDPDDALVGDAAFAADQALGAEAFEQRGQRAAVELQGVAEVADGGGSAVPQHAQDEVLRVREGVLGEGAAVLVLESEEHANARGAKVYAEAAGAGITADSHDIAQPDPAGLGATRAMKMALREAEMDPKDIAHINAHATSTPQGDLAEAMAIRNALGDDAAEDLMLTSTKSMTGHLLGAAGALESVAVVLALRDRVVPPTINLDDPEDIGLDVATEKRTLPEGTLSALNNSFGFGGHNVAIAYRSA
jgi:hypothetical protein